MPKLKALVEAIEEVEEQFRPLYKETDEGFVLELDDKDLKKKLEEFRTNNREKHKALEQAQRELERFKDVDPDKYREHEAKLRKIEEKKLLDEGQLDSVVATRTADMKADYEKRLKQLQDQHKAAAEELQEKTKKLSRMQLREKIQPAVESVGKVRQGAWRDIYRRAEELWQYDPKSDDFDPIENGEIKCGKKAEPLTYIEWAQDLLETAPHFFDGAVGGGAQGSRKATPGKRVIGGDMMEIGRNAEAIVKGDVEVRV